MSFSPSLKLNNSNNNNASGNQQSLQVNNNTNSSSSPSTTTTITISSVDIQSNIDHLKKIIEKTIQCPNEQERKKQIQTCLTNISDYFIQFYYYHLSYTLSSMNPSFSNTTTTTINNNTNTTTTTIINSNNTNSNNNSIFFLNNNNQQQQQYEVYFKQVTNILNISITLCLKTCGDNNQDVRMISNEHLNKIIKCLIETHSDKILVILFKSMKLNENNIYSIISSLNNFSEISKYIKPQKCKTMISFILPQIKNFIEIQNYEILENLSINLDKIFIILGKYINKEEIYNYLILELFKLLNHQDQEIRRFTSKIIGICCKYVLQCPIFQICIELYNKLNLEDIKLLQSILITFNFILLNNNLNNNIIEFTNIIFDITINSLNNYNDQKILSPSIELLNNLFKLNKFNKYCKVYWLKDKVIQLVKSLLNILNINKLITIKGSILELLQQIIILFPNISNKIFLENNFTIEYIFNTFIYPLEEDVFIRGNAAILFGHLLNIDTNNITTNIEYIDKYMYILFKETDHICLKMMITSCIYFLSKYIHLLKDKCSNYLISIITLNDSFFGVKIEILNLIKSLNFNVIEFYERKRTLQILLDHVIWRFLSDDNEMVRNQTIDTFISLLKYPIIEITDLERYSNLYELKLINYLILKEDILNIENKNILFILKKSINQLNHLEDKHSFLGTIQLLYKLGKLYKNNSIISYYSIEIIELLLDKLKFELFSIDLSIHSSILKTISIYIHFLKFLNLNKIEMITTILLNDYLMPMITLIRNIYLNNNTNIEINMNKYIHDKLINHITTTSKSFIFKNSNNDYISIIRKYLLKILYHLLLNGNFKCIENVTIDLIQNLNYFILFEKKYTILCIQSLFISLFGKKDKYLPITNIDNINNNIKINNLLFQQNFDSKFGNTNKTYKNILIMFNPMVITLMKTFKYSHDNKLKYLIIKMLIRMICIGIDFTQLDKDKSFIKNILKQLNEYLLLNNNNDDNNYFEILIDFISILIYIIKYNQFDNIMESDETNVENNIFDLINLFLKRNEFNLISSIMIRGYLLNKEIYNYYLNNLYKCPKSFINLIFYYKDNQEIKENISLEILNHLMNFPYHHYTDHSITTTDNSVNTVINDNNVDSNNNSGDNKKMMNEQVLLVFDDNDMNQQDNKQDNNVVNNNDSNHIVDSVNNDENEIIEDMTITLEEKERQDEEFFNLLDLIQQLKGSLNLTTFEKNKIIYNLQKVTTIYQLLIDITIISKFKIFDNTIYELLLIKSINFILKNKNRNEKLIIYLLNNLLNYQNNLIGNNNLNNLNKINNLINNELIELLNNYTFKYFNYEIYNKLLNIIINLNKENLNLENIFNKLNNYFHLNLKDFTNLELHNYIILQQVLFLKLIEFFNLKTFNLNISNKIWKYIIKYFNEYEIIKQFIHSYNGNYDNLFLELEELLIKNNTKLDIIDLRNLFKFIKEFKNFNNNFKENLNNLINERLKKENTFMKKKILKDIQIYINKESNNNSINSNNNNYLLNLNKEMKVNNENLIIDYFMKYKTNLKYIPNIVSNMSEKSISILIKNNDIDFIISILVHLNNNQLLPIIEYMNQELNNLILINDNFNYYLKLSILITKLIIKSKYLLKNHFIKIINFTTDFIKLFYKNRLNENYVELMDVDCILSLTCHVLQLYTLLVNDDTPKNGNLIDMGDHNNKGDNNSIDNTSVDNLKHVIEEMIDLTCQFIFDATSVIPYIESNLTKMELKKLIISKTFKSSITNNNAKNSNNNGLSYYGFTIGNNIPYISYHHLKLIRKIGIEIAKNYIYLSYEIFIPKEDYFPRIDIEQINILIIMIKNISCNEYVFKNIFNLLFDLLKSELTMNQFDEIQIQLIKCITCLLSLMNNNNNNFTNLESLDNLENTNSWTNLLTIIQHYLMINKDYNNNKNNNNLKIEIEETYASALFDSYILFIEDSLQKYLHSNMMITKEMIKSLIIILEFNQQCYLKSNQYTLQWLNDLFKNLYKDSILSDDYLLQRYTIYGITKTNINFTNIENIDYFIKMLETSLNNNHLKLFGYKSILNLIDNYKNREIIVKLLPFISNNIQIWLLDKEQTVTHQLLLMKMITIIVMKFPEASVHQLTKKIMECLFNLLDDMNTPIYIIISLFKTLQTLLMNYSLSQLERNLIEIMTSIKQQDTTPPFTIISNNSNNNNHNHTGSSANNANNNNNGTGGEKFLKKMNIDISTFTSFTSMLAQNRALLLIKKPTAAFNMEFFKSNSNNNNTSTSNSKPTTTVATNTTSTTGSSSTSGNNSSSGSGGTSSSSSGTSSIATTTATTMKKFMSLFTTKKTTPTPTTTNNTTSNSNSNNNNIQQKTSTANNNTNNNTSISSSSVNNNITATTTTSNLLSTSSARRVLLLGLMITSMYTSSITTINNNNSVTSLERERAKVNILHLIEQFHDGEIDREGELLLRFIPQLMEDFFESEQILPLIYNEYLSSKTHPLLLSLLLSIHMPHIYKNIKEYENWIQISLQTLSMKQPMMGALWALLCLFISVVVGEYTHHYPLLIYFGSNHSINNWNSFTSHAFLMYGLMFSDYLKEKNMLDTLNLFKNQILSQLMKDLNNTTMATNGMDTSNSGLDGNNNGMDTSNSNQQKQQQQEEFLELLQTLSNSIN
ncbi:hypothetical protein ABK040_011793 [Willaertia magna]